MEALIDKHALKEESNEEKTKNEKSPRKLEQSIEGNKVQRTDTSCYLNMTG